MNLKEYINYDYLYYDVCHNCMDILILINQNLFTVLKYKILI